MVASRAMASRRGAKGVNIGDVEELLRKGKQIRKKYKALKQICDRSKDGKVVAPAQIRKLADELKKAIDEAHTGPARTGPPKPRLPVLQRPAAPPPVRMTVAQVIPPPEKTSRVQQPGLGRMLLGFIANRLGALV
jgi:hypothetical protein